MLSFLGRSHSSLLLLLLLLLAVVRSDARANSPSGVAIARAAGDNHAAAVAATTTATHERRLAVATFEIPVFSLAFRSFNVLEGNVAEDLALLGSTLAGPLEEILGEFCHESFRIQTARLSSQGTALPDMVRQLLSVDFDVEVCYQQRSAEEDQDRTRSRGLQQQQSQWLDFNAQFKGVANFVQPTDPADQKSDDYMQQLLGSWLQQYLIEDFTVLESMMRASEDPVLKNMEGLAVVNGAQPAVFPCHATANEESLTGGDSNKLPQLLLSLLVVVATATMAAVFFLVRPHMASHRASKNNKLGAFPHHEDPAHRLSLAGRGGDDDVIDPQALEESDRWLKQHRPDLFRVIQRTESARSVQRNDTNEGVMNENGRRSNPLQFLYGGMFVRKHKLVEPSLHLARGDSDLEELETGDEPTMETLTPSWWQKLALSLHGRPLACEEDPSQYDFAFSDFPRHDGTPCLIYQETENGPTMVMRAPGGASTKQALSNDAFLRQLSMHGENVTFEETTTSLDEEDQAASPEFTTKLERLVAMRHRHYEKERLIQKGRQARNQERKKAEARERELKLRRHEMELDLGEIEASLTPRALSRKNFSTTETVPDGRKAHRVTVSDSEYMAAVEGDTTSAHHVTSNSRGQGELGTIGGPSLRNDYNESMGGRRTVDPRHARNRSDILPGTPQPRSLTPSPEKRLRSHRRSLSHGTEATEEKKVDQPTLGRQRSGSTSEDVMAFGIAAYTNFV